MTTTSQPVPLWAPLYGASIGQAWTRFWKKYATFSGRASRSEYWWWFLISVVIGIVLEIITLAVSGGTGMGRMNSDGSMIAPNAGAIIMTIILIIWGLGTIIPGLALLARRLHDVNLSAWFIFIGLVPFVGGIILLIMAILPSNQAGQRFDRPIS
ncbi:MAG: inner rane protein YhaH [Subtercola sp.]|nr:inner rane protein YhaH [Subtercola sp.]